MSSNNRASLLAGLRTGGVRQPSQMPLTAAPNVTSFGRPELPMSASIGGSFNQIHPSQAHAQAHAQQQALQMQMMQMEILRLQALQQQQFQQQYELARQQQQQQQQQVGPNHHTFQHYGEVPHSAAPTVATFTNRRASQAEHLKSQLHLNYRLKQEEQQAPMTASLNGKFGGRLNPNASAFRMGSFPEGEEMVDNRKPVNNGLTTVISGGATLGIGNGAAAGNGMTPSKSDTSLNWRRGGNNNSVLSGNRAASISVRVTPPPGERNASPPGYAKAHRPEPLRFSVIHEAPSTPVVIVDSSEGEAGDDGDDGSSSSSKSEPTTPPSGGASDVPPLSPREMASKRLYEGLGIGRPVPQSAAFHALNFAGVKAAPYTSIGTTFPTRIVSQPSRQPRGPPSGDELGSKNFASRIRRKAIGGLGAMLDARVNRQEIEAF